MRSEILQKTSPCLLVNIENPELCSSVTTKKEWLDKRGKAAMLVKQSRLNLHSVPWSKNNVCTFKVGAITHGNSLIPKLFGTFSNHETGVVAVIQVNHEYNTHG